MNYSPAKTLILFFLGLIGVGTALLSIPISNTSNNSIITNLFTSVSSVCVTGLSIVNIGKHYSVFGQLVILVLVQLGSMGYMFISTVLALLLGKMTLKDRRIMQDMFDISSFNGLKKLLIKAIFFVLTIELVGAVLLTLIFLNDFPLIKSIYLGFFYSITSFCNSGFSFFDDSLIQFANNPAMLYVISVLIILGGLGFFVLVDIYDTYKEKRLHLLTHTKVVIFMSVVITLFAFIMFLFSNALEGRGALFSINNAFFQAVSSRTAGFYSVPVEFFGEIVDIILLLLMSIGASPGNTAGGIKITTIALVCVFIVSILKGDEDFILFKKRIPSDLVKKALAIFVIFFVLIVFFSVVLVLVESDLRSLYVIFEVVSAFATVGISLGITAKLSLLGKVIIIIAMLTGRIGILALLLSMTNPIAKKRNIKYPHARLLVG